MLVMLPRHMNSLNSGKTLIDSLMPDLSGFHGTVTVWHVVKVRPFTGSIGSWLSTIARKIERSRSSVYFDVVSMTEAEAERRIANGELPDVISFPSGFIQPYMLCPIDLTFDFDVSSGTVDNVLYAVPYAASARFILYRCSGDDIESISSEKLEELTSSTEAFKSGKADACIADARLTADMIKSIEAGKTESFDVMPFEKAATLVQFLGITQRAKQEKLPLIENFIDLVTSSQNAASLSRLGILAINAVETINFDYDFLNETYRMIREGEGIGVNAFQKAGAVN